MGKTIKQLNEELEALKKENEELKKEKYDALDTVGTLRESVSTYKAELETMKLERDIYKSSVERIAMFVKKDTKIPYSIIEHVRGKDLTAAKKEYDLWYKTTCFNSYDAGVKFAKDEAADEKHDVEELKNKNTHMERKIDTLRSIIRNTRDDNDELKEAIAKKDKDYEALERKCNNLREVLSSLCVAAVDADDVRKAIDEENWDFVRNAIHEYANYWFNKTDHVKEVETNNHILREMLAAMCVHAGVSDTVRRAIDDNKWDYVRREVYNYVSWAKNAEHVKELEDQLAKKDKDYDALEKLCHDISDTLNRWRHFVLNYLEWSEHVVDKVEQGYYVEAKAALSLLEPSLRTKYENLKTFVRRNCVVAADMNKMKEAIEDENWDKAKALVNNYLRAHVEAADIIKDEQLKKLEAENDILKGKNKELLDENAGLEWKNRVYSSNLSESADCIKDLHNENEKLRDAITRRNNDNEKLKKDYDDLKGRFKHCDDKLTRLRNFMLDNLNYTGTAVQKIELGRYFEALAIIAQNENPKTTLNKIYGAGGDLDSDYPNLRWEHAGEPLFHWDTDTNTYTLNLNGTHIDVVNDGSVILKDCKISHNARAGCYTFDIGRHHIVATNGGHIFIDKE